MIRPLTIPLAICAGFFCITSCKEKPTSEEATQLPNGRTPAFDASDSKHPSQILFSADSLPNGMSWKNSTLSLDPKRYIWSCSVARLATIWGSEIQ